MDEHEMCQNCKRDVPVSNYKMHTLHCARNISKCDICQEPVNSSDMETHKDLVHTDKPCSDCGEAIKTIDLEEHKENACPKRNVLCSFCETHVKSEELESHEGYCGSRTEKCPECGDFVMLNEWVKHSEMRLYHELANKPCAEVFGHNDTGGATPWIPLTTTSSSLRNTSDYSWSPSILAGPSSSTFSVTSPTSLLHERRHSSASSTQPSSSSQIDSSIPDLELISSRKSSLSGMHRVPTSTSPPTSASVYNGSHYQSPTGFDFNIGSEDTKEEEEEILIPCEFCGASINMFKVILHQTKCDRNPDSIGSKQRSHSISQPIEYKSPLNNGPPLVNNDLTTTSTVSSGPIVSDMLSMKDISALTPNTSRRSSLRKDSIVEKYLRQPPQETRTDSNGYTGGARAKTTFKPVPSPMSESKDEESNRKRPQRKVSAPVLLQRPPPHPITKSMTSPKSTPNLQDLGKAEDSYKRSIGSSSQSNLNNDINVKTPQRKYSQVSNGNGDRDDREDLRQLLVNLRKDPFDDDLENNDGSFFPCEFCGDPYPVEYLMRHQLSCDLNPNPVSSGDGFNYDLIRNRIENNLNIE
ncbi:uncharacterized protein [Lepeophtheirus salmonis]|uniref:uncharacterized protein isoform X1 n=2 Tax=Lepeophtheirus salmonis TaxID=72036 RepID=UPI001AE1F827|nr:TRAF-type zinc finger domain-containing protein 1-like [Lepeophtheirus salmonis]